jgi:hypothetical protein
MTTKKTRQSALYITSDEQPFFSRAAALRHAITLSDREVRTVESNQMDRLMHALETGDYDQKDNYQY